MNQSSAFEPEPLGSESELEARWNEECAAAEDEDRKYSAATWVPPIKGAFLRAGRATSLRRLFPFSAMSQVCFSARRDQWLDERAIAPAFVALGPDGEYHVYRGPPYPQRDEDLEEILRTNDPAAAARALAELLDDWPR